MKRWGGEAWSGQRIGSYVPYVLFVRRTYDTPVVSTLDLQPGRTMQIGSKFPTAAETRLLFVCALEIDVGLPRVEINSN